MEGQAKSILTKQDSSLPGLAPTQAAVREHEQNRVQVSFLRPPTSTSMTGLALV